MAVPPLLLVLLVTSSVAVAAVRWARPVPRSRLGVSVTIMVTAVVSLVVVTAARLADGATWMTRYDDGAAQWASAHVNGLAVDSVLLVTYLGTTIAIITMALATALYAWRRTRSWQIPVFLLAVVLGQTLINNLIKVIVERPRPQLDPALPLQTWSFPSGHATAAAATYLAIATVLGGFVRERTRAILIAVAVGTATVVGFTRVLLGVHWFSDVLVGLLVGWSWFAVCFIAFWRSPHREWGSGSVPEPGHHRAA